MKVNRLRDKIKIRFNMIENDFGELTNEIEYQAKELK